MFQKTLLKLTALNSVVLLLILVWFGGGLYGFVGYQLFDEIDDALRDRLAAFRISGGRPGFSRPVAFDPRIYLLVRGDDNRVHAFYPLDNADTVRAVAAGATAGRPAMQHVGGRFYRAVAAPYGPEDRLLRLPAEVVAVREVVAVAVVDSEVAMLRRLLGIIAAAAALGVLAAVTAGYFLARRALVPIRTAWERQQQFVADASHELRTPLTVIKTNAELLLRYPGHTIQEESARITSVVRETIRMSRLVGTMLTLARADAGQPELRPEKVALAGLIAGAGEQFAPLAAQKGIDLRVEPANATITADRERLYQLLVILLDNAVKYTPPGGTVSLTCRRSAGQVLVTVADTGCGIPAEDVPRIFDRFFRGNRARTRGEGGAGLGLAIAKWIAESHGGKIRAESRVGGGTQIFVTLPLDGG